MLTITIPANEGYDEERNEFISFKGQTICLEHSLVSLSKWESKWHKPFTVDNDKTNEELKDYIRCMTITQNVDPSVYDNIRREQLQQIVDYINDPMTATTFYENGQKQNQSRKEIITAEIIYYWMISYNIPVEFQKWHLNRLLTLIKVCSIKNDTSSKKMSKREIMSRNAALNAARRNAHNTKG